MNLNEYIKDNFSNFPIEKPLFYSGQSPEYSYGAIRFEIGNPKLESGIKYCTYAYLRSVMLFEEVFNESNNMYIVINSLKLKNEEIDVDSCQRYIKKYTKNKIDCFEILPCLYGHDENDEEEEFIGFRYYLTCKVKDVDYKKILKDICFAEINDDYNDDYNEVFFINADKHIIYHLYDDRGADIVSNKISTLKPIYNKYYKWILDYDKNRIDNIFNK